MPISFLLLFHNCNADHMCIPLPFFPEQALLPLIVQIIFLVPGKMCICRCVQNLLFVWNGRQILVSWFWFGWGIYVSVDILSELFRDSIVALMVCFFFFSTGMACLVITKGKNHCRIGTRQSRALQRAMVILLSPGCRIPSVQSPPLLVTV